MRPRPHTQVFRLHVVVWDAGAMITNDPYSRQQPIPGRGGSGGGSWWDKLNGRASWTPNQPTPAPTPPPANPGASQPAPAPGAGGSGGWWDKLNGRAPW